MEVSDSTYQLAVLPAIKLSAPLPLGACVKNAQRWKLVR
jgi:hypothetical protein